MPFQQDDGQAAAFELIGLGCKEDRKVWTNETVMPKIRELEITGKNSAGIATW